MTTIPWSSRGARKTKHTLSACRSSQAAKHTACRMRTQFGRARTLSKAGLLHGTPVGDPSLHLAYLPDCWRGYNPPVQAVTEGGHAAIRNRSYIDVMPSG